MKSTLKNAGQETDIAIGSRIQKIRKTVGLSQEKVANHLGITFQQMQKYEKGTNRVGVHALLEMCKIFHCQPMDIISAAWDGGDPDDDALAGVVDAVSLLQAKIDAARKALA